MDDSIPSGENKLPLFVSFGAIAVAIIALLFAFKARSETKAANDIIKSQADRIETVSGDLRNAQASFAKSSDVQAVQGSVDDFKKEVGERLLDVNKGFQAQSLINKELAGGRGHATTPGATKGGEPVVAGPGEYIVKSGDTFAKIARTNGTTIAALTAVNPGVKSNSLKLGQKIKLPAAKAPAAPATKPN